MSFFYAPTKILSKIKHHINSFCGLILFAIENYSKRYPYILLGEKHQNEAGLSSETILLYRITGKRHIFEISAKEMCNAQNLISKFHPLDVRIISFIAGVEHIITVPVEKRTEKFELLKKSIFSAKIMK